MNKLVFPSAACNFYTKDFFKIVSGTPDRIHKCNGTSWVNIEKVTSEIPVLSCALDVVSLGSQYNSAWGTSYDFVSRSCTVGQNVANSQTDNTVIGKYAGYAGNHFIADLADISSGYPWGCYGNDIGGLTNFNPKQNTYWIHAASCPSYPNKAASLCYNKSPTGNWYLPGGEHVPQLRLMWQNRASIGGFTNNHYWTSIPDFSLNGAAVSVNFNTGGYHQTSNYRYNNYNVRCVRDF